MSAKRKVLVWFGIILGLAALVVILHATHVLPLPPAPPYKDGEGNMITPKNPWTW